MIDISKCGQSITAMPISALGSIKSRVFGYFFSKENRLDPGDRVRSARAALRLTTRALGEAMGISGSVISEWESSKLLIRQPNAMALELLFGISWKWLMTGEGEMWTTELPAWVATRLKDLSAERPAVPPPSQAQVIPTEGLVQVAQNLAIAQCQAAGTAGDPEKMVEAFRDILGRLQG